jgi:hypothetical protein
MNYTGKYWDWKPVTGGPTENAYIDDEDDVDGDDDDDDDDNIIAIRKVISVT